MKPKSVEIYPVYICSDCGSRHSESLDYVKKVGKILCGCGYVLELTPIETFKVSPVFKSKKALSPQPPKLIATKHKKEPPQQKLSYSIEQAVLLLTSLGFKKTEATEKAKSAIDDWQSKNREQLTEENFEEFANYLIFS